MIILDFYGLPGSGKSAVSHEVAKILNRNKIVCEPSYDIDHNKSKYGRILRKAIYSIVWVFLHPYKCYRLFYIIQSHKLSLRCLITEMTNLIVKAMFVEKNTNCDYLLFDEGFAQALISIDNMLTSIVNDELREIETIIGNTTAIYHVYINEEIDVSLDRMEKRSSNDSRVEKEPSFANKLKMMNRYRTLCEAITLNDPIILKGNNKDASTIASELVDILLKNGERV